MNSLRIACAFGTHANILKAGSWRIGGLDRFPLSDAWDGQAWGLSWQSFPACFAHKAGLWAFAQWHVQWADGTMRSHPAVRKHDAYLNNALVPDGNACSGSTRTKLTENSLTIERQMPHGHPDWAHLHDQWSIFLSPLFEVVPIETDGWQGIRICAPSADAQNNSIDLLLRAGQEISPPHLTRNGNHITLACPLPTNGNSPRPCLTWKVVLNT